MKKWIGMGAFYCARCGTRLQQGNDLCPQCGWDTGRALRTNQPRETVRATPQDVMESKAFRTYQRKNTLWKLIWAVALAAGVPWGLLTTGQIDLNDQEGRIVAGVLCAMFLAIGIGSSVLARRGREWRRKAASEGRACCIACGFHPGKHDVFCAKCGCAIINAAEGQASSD